MIKNAFCKYCKSEMCVFSLALQCRFAVEKANHICFFHWFQSIYLSSMTSLCVCLFVEDIRQKYGELQGELLLVELEKDRQGLGLSLAGNRDRSCMSIFVVGINPGGPASRDGCIRVGDELLEVSTYTPYIHQGLMYDICTVN